MLSILRYADELRDFTPYFEGHQHQSRSGSRLRGAPRCWMRCEANGQISEVGWGKAESLTATTKPASDGALRVTLYNGSPKRKSGRTAGLSVPPSSPSRESHSREKWWTVARTRRQNGASP